MFLELVLFYIKGCVRRSSAMAEGLCMALMMLSIFYISSNELFISEGVSTGILVSCLIVMLASISSSTVSWYKDSGVLRYIILSGIDRYVLILSLKSVLLLINAIAGLAVLVIVYFMIPMLDAVKFFYIYLMNLPAIVLIFLFVAIISCSDKGSIMHYILSAPLLVPNIICICGGMHDISYIKLAIGIQMIYVPVLLLVCKYAIRFAV